MTDFAGKGHFYVTDLPDGGVVAASSSSPYFCFRAATEADVLAKVEDALSFYFGQTAATRKVEARPAARVHNWAGRRAVAYPERLVVAG